MRSTFYPEAEKPRKPYSLVQGLMIICLALAAYAAVRHARLHPEQLSEWICYVSSQQTATQVANAVERDESGEPEDVAIQAARMSESSLVDGMERVERELCRVFANCGHDGPNDVLRRRVDQLVRQSDAFHDRLQSEESLTDAERRTAKMQLLKTHFLASRMNRRESIARFDAIAQQLIDEPQFAADAAKVASLQLLKKHKLDSPDVRRLITDLTTFVAAYPDSPLGAHLFSATSHELWQNGLPSSSNEVLRAGISIYYGQPEGNKMVSQLAEQDDRSFHVRLNR